MKLNRNQKSILFGTETNKTLCTVRKRKTLKIIRYRRYQLDRDEVNYFREKIMLYVKWRDEESDILNKDIRNIFSQNIEQIQRIESQFIADSTIDYDDIKEKLEIERNKFEEPMEQQLTSNEYQIFDPQGRESALDIDIPSHKTDNKEKGVTTFRTPRCVTEDQYNELIRSLNQRQRQYLTGLFLIKL